MRFILIDKIKSLEKDREVRAVKNVSLAEEYLSDHFPTYPVLPGVFLLQGMIESASWLVRESQDFSKSIVLLHQAKNVKYKSFLAPGGQIEYTVQAKSIEDGESSFIGSGSSGETKVIEARFSLRHFNLADRDSLMAETDASIVENLKKRLSLLKL